ncbi:MAG: hypothetical protein WCO25_00130 [Candidatus Uhrbacteria bacterium]
MGIITYLRSFRFGEYAIFDFTVSFVAVYLLAPYLSRLGRKFNLDISRRSWLYLTLPISVVVHLVFVTFTPMTRNVLDLHGHYLLKVIMVGLIVLGVKDIKQT